MKEITTKHPLQCIDLNRTLHIKDQEMEEHIALLEKIVSRFESALKDETKTNENIKFKMRWVDYRNSLYFVVSEN